MDEVRSHVCLDLPSFDGKADPKIVPLILESHTGRAFAPSPKRSTSPQATSTLEWLDSLKALDPNRPIREADIDRHNRSVPATNIQVLQEPPLTAQDRSYRAIFKNGHRRESGTGCCVLLFSPS